MWLGFRIANVCFQRTPFILCYHLRCKLDSSAAVSVSQVSTNDEFLPRLRRKSGEEISSVLSIGNSIYGSSLFASTHIQAGDCILKVPFSAQLTPDNLLPEMKSLLEDNVGNVAKLAIVILMERKLGQDFEWAPYINSLPPVGEMHSTIFWSKEELEMVQQSPVYKETIIQQTQIEKEFSAIRPALDHFPQFFEGITFDDFRHAYALDFSFADFSNHDAHSDAILLGDEHKQTSEVIAGRDYVPGEQVLIRYGKFPNSTLLLDFGFTIADNIYDQVQICIDVPENDRLRIMKLDLWHKHHMASTTSINGVVEDFLIHDINVLVALAERQCSSNELKQGIAKVLSIIDNQHQPWSNGVEMLEDARQNKHVLSTGCKGIDSLLRGGLREGQLIELVGPSSSGKTQVCQQAASHVAHKHRGVVVFVDTCNSFAAKRIACFINRLLYTSTQGKCKNLERIMSRILCQSVFNIFGLLDVLHQLELKLASQVMDGDSKVRLLIIDSFSSLITPILGSSGAQGYSLMISAGFLLKKLGHEHNLSVLVTNHTVGGEGGYS